MTAASQEAPPELLVVGSGINVPAHLTLEARAAIVESDRVLYLASGWTAALLQRLRPDALDLAGFYDSDTPRRQSYEMMAQIVLVEATNHRRTCLVSYGHPGVFGFPMHRAIELARRAGLRARMLPGVSAEDCLFADLGIDPARQGCQTHEATDFLARVRRIDPTVPLILWQADVIADLSGKFADGQYHSRNIEILAEILADLYDEDHPVIVYVAADAPLAEPRMERVSVRRLPEVDLTDSTLYIPPSHRIEYDHAMIERLGLPRPD